MTMTAADVFEIMELAESLASRMAEYEKRRGIGHVGQTEIDRDSARQALAEKLTTLLYKG